MKRNRIKTFAVLLAVLGMVGCAAQGSHATLPTGALNQFDATSYESLMGAQAVLNSAKADVSKLPVGAKPILNKAIASYNVAEAAWQAYHAGSNNDQAALQKAIAQATADVAALLVQMSGGH